MTADHCRKNDAHDHDRGYGYGRDCDLGGADDDVEMILVKFSVCSNLLSVTIVRSMPSTRFDVAVPCRAYQHSAPTPPRSMNLLNFVTQRAA